MPAAPGCRPLRLRALRLPEAGQPDAAPRLRRIRGCIWPEELWNVLEGVNYLAFARNETILRLILVDNKIEDITGFITA